MDMLKPIVDRSAVGLALQQASRELGTALEQTLVLAFLGSASSGKDSAIKALFGIDFGQIDPIPGSTREVRVVPLDASGRVHVVNAPGFGDLRAEVERAARGVLDHLDIAVYLVNCDGGATIDERRDLDAIRGLGRPTLVVLNKIDLIRPHQRDDFVRTTLAQLGVSPSQSVVAAFDPLPVLSEQPIGVEPTIAWIHEQLSNQGKQLLFAKSLRNKAVACEPLIQSAARMAAAAGAIPVPGADMAAVTAIQVKLISDIAAVHGVEIGRDMAFFIMAEVLAGGSKGFVRWAVNSLKAVGWIPGGQLAEVAASALGASVAGAATFGVGRAAVLFVQRGQKADGDELRRVFDTSAFGYQAEAAAEASRRGATGAGVVDVDVEPKGS
jgi:GTPase